VIDRLGVGTGFVEASVVQALAPISNDEILANISGSTAPPVGNTLTAVIDATIGDTVGDILVRGASVWQQENLSTLLDASVGSSPGSLLYRGSSAWTALAPSTYGGTLLESGQVGPPAWQQAAPGFGGLIVSAFNNGSTDATAEILVWAGQNLPLFFPAGTYLVSGNISFTQPVTMAAGATFKSTTAITLDFEQGCYAAREQIFNLSGGAVAQFSNQIVGFPEWWGAQVNTPTLDCSVAINACIAALSVTTMQEGAYYIQNQINVLMGGRTLRGVAATQLPSIGGGSSTLATYATQIVMTSPSANCMFVGYNQNTQPAVNLEFVTLEDFAIYRATAAVPLGVSGAAAIDNPTSGVLPCPTGIQFKWCVNLHCNRVLIGESSIGFYIYGCIESYWNNCSVLRYTPGQNTGNDNFSGFYLDYSAPLAANGGNASIYLDYCRVFSNCNTQAYTYAAGMTTADGFVDLFVFKFETGLIQYGIDCQGSGTGATYNSEDLHLVECYLDSSALVAMRVQNGANYSNVSILGGYVNSVNGTCIFINDIPGIVSIQGVGGIDTTSSTGLSILNCGQVSAIGNTWMDFDQPIVVNAASECEIRDIVRRQRGGSPPFPGISLTGVVDSLVAVAVSGPSGGYTAGVTVDSTSQGIEVNCTKFNSATIGGAANKIVYNGSPWGGGTTFGTRNVATGVLN
jgi:hypothetical protein